MSNDFLKAFSYAYDAHLGQPRKNTKIPYIVHPMDVASILMKHNAPDHVVIAGILHDVIEDGGKTISEISNLFGENVAKLVDGASKPARARNRALFCINPFILI